MSTSPNFSPSSIAVPEHYSEGETSIYVLSPSPLLWIQELESFNDSAERLPLWHELSMRARQRGTGPLNGRDWPGPVLLPSGVMDHLLHKGRIGVPDRWNKMSRHDLTRFLALLNGWRSERLIFDFNGLAAEIVLNSQVNILLNAQNFSLMPSHAIYIDFESVDFRERNLPGGCFVGLNADDDNRLELVLGLDRCDRMEIHTIRLDGLSVDQAMQAMTRRLRNAGSNQKTWHDAAAFIDHHVHTLLSAVVMVSSTTAQYEHLNDGLSRPDGRGPWSRWRISRVFTPPMNAAYLQALQTSAKGPPVVVAEWVSPSPSVLPCLRCCIGTREEWGSRTGMPAEYISTALGKLT